MVGTAWYCRTAHIVAPKKLKERTGLGTRYNLQRHISTDLLPLARPHIPQFPPTPKIMPAAGDEPHVKPVNLWETFHIQPTADNIVDPGFVLIECTHLITYT
jgi:hypothetical protein